LIPALPPRLLTAVLAVIGNQRIVDRVFGWYLEQAAPQFADRAQLADAADQSDARDFASASQ